MFFIFPQSLNRITSIRPTSSFKISSYSSFRPTSSFKISSYSSSINHPILQRLLFLDFLNLETGTDRFSRNVSMEFVPYAE